MASTDNITGLPIELLGEIFLHCSAYSPDIPLVVRAVCRTFYHATQITPQLWTYVKISTKDDVLAAHKATLWFSKAGACAMKLLVEIDTFEEKNSHVQLLATLVKYRARIASLRVHAQTEPQVLSFLSSIYTSPSAFPDSRSFLRLTVRIESEYPAADAQPLFPFVSTPLLSSMDLITPTLPNLTNIDFAHLQSLDITRPLRSLPIPMKTIIDTLTSSPCLVRFHFETRFDLSTEQVSSPQTNVDIRPKLITLQKLTHLSLRTNNNPALLGVFVVPDLRSLHLNALDGRRRGRAEETASSLRLLLLRMEDPFGIDKGIEVLELGGVDISRTSQATVPNEVWEWCFRRMRSLRQITARNTDPEHLVELLTLGIGSSSVPASTRLGLGTGDGSAEIDSRLENAVCPRLECLAVPLPLPDGSIAMKEFKVMRPSVKVLGLGHGFGHAEGSTCSPEEALKPRKVTFLSPIVAKDAILGEGEETFEEKGMADIKDARTGGDLNGAHVAREVLQLQHTNPDDFEVAAAAVSSPVVGGFGFGSQFARMRSKVAGIEAARIL